MRALLLAISQIVATRLPGPRPTGPNARRLTTAHFTPHGDTSVGGHQHPLDAR